jgi:hypothetical protein
MAKHRNQWAERFTHYLGNRSARHQSTFLDDLFSIQGSEGITRALNIAKSISDHKLQERIYRAIIEWNGDSENESQARSIVTGYAYISAILAFDRAVLSRISTLKACARHLLEIRSEKAQERNQEIAPEQLDDPEINSTSREIQVLLISNAPAIAPNYAISKSI